MKRGRSSSDCPSPDRTPGRANRHHDDHGWTRRCVTRNIICRRTTLSLDDDVAAKLQEETRRRKTSFKAVVNDCLRRGLEASSEAELAAPATEDRDFTSFQSVEIPNLIDSRG